MTLQSLRQLHGVFVDQWNTWVDDLPEAYKADGFITKHVPVAVTIRYGQNRRIDISNQNAEREKWNKSPKFNYIMEFTFALATHISCVVCSLFYGVSLVIYNLLRSIASLRSLIGM